MYSFTVTNAIHPNYAIYLQIVRTKNQKNVCSERTWGNTRGPKGLWTEPAQLIASTIILLGHCHLHTHTHTHFKTEFLVTRLSFYYKTCATWTEFANSCADIILCVFGFKLNEFVRAHKQFEPCIHIPCIQLAKQSSSDSE